jgi:hypothetical protein
MIRLWLNIVQRHTQHVCRLVLGSPSVSGSVELVKGTLLRTKAGWIAFFSKPIVKDFLRGSCLWFLSFFVRSLLCLAWFVTTLCPFLSSCVSFCCYAFAFFGKEKHFSGRMCRIVLDSACMFCRSDVCILA